MSELCGNKLSPAAQAIGQPHVGQTPPGPPQLQPQPQLAALGGDGTLPEAIGPQQELLLLPDPDPLLELEEELLDEPEPLDMPAPPRESR